MNRTIVEIGFEINSERELEYITDFCDRASIPYYIEPQRKNPYKTLEELEADCEGK